MLLLLTSCALQTYAEPNPIKRAEIRAKRTGVPPGTEEGLAASREFIRTDSTYYVGWMYQGLYQSERAADHLGYKAALRPLEKALDLLERDYANELKVKTADPYAYYAVQALHVDHSTIAYYLFQAYQNAQLEDKSYALLRRVQKWDLQKNWMLEPYNMLAWLTHRNRFHTAQNFSFLRGNIAENEKLANAYLDSALLHSQQMARYNAGIFSEFYTQHEKLSVYHYKCILHAYNFNIDSAEHYFNLMEGSVMFPYNNHGTFLAIQAKFREALDEYQIASRFDMGDKKLQEWAYYSSILNIYRGMPLRAAVSMREMIKASGSTPGFGWYNIALARACSYQGNVEDSKKYIDRAAGFKEVHIGTTLGRSHYEFAVNLMRLINTTRSYDQVKFEDKNWWWKPGAWYSLAKLRTEKYAQQYLITNQFAADPERENVIYKLFSTESIVSWDEIWYLIKDLSTNFFYKKFEEELRQDKRERVYKYYHLFLAKLDIKKGNYSKAQERLLKMLGFKEDIDAPYEMLFLARVYEALAICADEKGDDAAFKFYASKVYSTYPQLLPYAEFRPQVQFNISGTNKAVEKQLRKFSIKWVENDRYAPKVNISFEEQNNRNTIKYTVVDHLGNVIVPQRKINVDNAAEAARELAYGIFNIVPLDPQTDIDQPD